MLHHDKQWNTRQLHITMTGERIAITLEKEGQSLYIGNGRQNTDFL